ncbi:ACT domain-containing protein [Catenisphaera adipataccumulans]|jgi:ACT domain-containing protein|uniref:UPF0237 protein HNQ47_001525 n=1 Tax=Catenisphaera adipataccumulans TaxID=700500 RepID=A0A7W8FVT6_9FIRM|nr:ACT domain-containing protein [Catenisphaera adipataccumulans]MBB5183503.1 ACT domain-containing protein [Catenisphaera adipataccumulans]
MKAVISVVGEDKVGILATVSGECAKAKINILDVSQTIVNGVFTMTMIVEMTNEDYTLSQFAEHMEKIGKQRGLVIRVMHQDIFKSMYEI